MHANDHHAANRTAREFAVPPVPKVSWLALLGLGVLLPVAGIALAFWLGAVDGAEGRWGLWGALAFVLLLGAWLAVVLRRRSVQLQGGTLVVKAAFYTRKVPLAELELERGRVVDLGEHTQLKPLLKTNGYSLPGFHAGHYRLRDRSKAFLLVTDRRRVLLLPVAGAAALLLSLERPAALLDALRQAREAAGRYAHRTPPAPADARRLHDPRW